MTKKSEQAPSQVAPSKMRYTIISSWIATGGLSLSDDSKPLELLRTGDYKFVLTRSPDSELQVLDRGLALLVFMMRGGNRGLSDIETASRLSSSVDEIRSERAEKIGGRPVLIAEATGEIDITKSAPINEIEGERVGFDLVDKSSVVAQHAQAIDSMRLALSLESSHAVRYTPLRTGVYLTDGDGRTVHCPTLQAGAPFAVSVAGAVTPAIAASACARFDQLRKAAGFQRVHRLALLMNSTEASRFEAFLAGWSAIEILIGKAFKGYEDRFFSLLSGSVPAGARDRFLNRIKQVMKGKYTLADRFTAVAAVLFSDAPDAELEEDYASFVRLKLLRDSIFHGDAFSEDELPIEELSRLVHKFVIAQTDDLVSLTT